MTGSGRPLRFLCLIMLGWMAIRTVALWHDTGSLPEAMRRALPIKPSLPAAHSRPLAMAPAPARAAEPAGPLVRRAAVPPRGSVASLAMPRGDEARRQRAPLAASQVGERVPLDEASYASSAVTILLPDAAGAASLGGTRVLPVADVARVKRLSFSSWLIVRDGRGVGASLSDPQLGGAQGGVRVDYGLGSGLALTGRLAVPAAGAGREASIGLAWRPRGVPVRLVAEQRVALDGGRGGPALGVSGGVSEMPLPARFRLEAYGQGGAIARRGVEPYADGSARVARPALELAGVLIDAGAGAWGGAQRSVARLDIGPTIGARVPVVGKTVRLALDWRQRIAGDARPGSGPSLSIGSDF